MKQLLLLLLCIILTGCVITTTKSLGPKNVPSKVIQNLSSKFTPQTYPNTDTSKAIVEVQIIDEHNESIAFATVVISNSKKKFVDTTNIDGLTTVEKIPPGKYQLMATYVGYNKLTYNINIEAGNAYKIKIRMGNSMLDDVFISY